MGNVDGPSIVLVTMAAAAVLSNIGAYGPLRLQIAMSPLILSCVALSGDQAKGEVAAATRSGGAQQREAACRGARSLSGNAGRRRAEAVNACSEMCWFCEEHDEERSPHGVSLVPFNEGGLVRGQAPPRKCC